MGTKRERIDRLLVLRELAESGAKAQAMIMAGEIFVDGERIDKPGKRFPEDVNIEVRPSAPRFVSRGGEKLAGALDIINFDTKDLIVLDIGSSTGGFTDCLLQRGAARVYAVDVGKGQLDWRLRQDPRVVVMEGVNARNLKSDDLPELVDLAVFDTSFISLTIILPAVVPLVKEGGILLPMVKPQFEVGKGEVPKGGVVRDPAVHADVLRRMISFMYNSSLTIHGVVASPLPGPKGNREFFIHAERTQPNAAPDMETAIEKAVHELD